MSAWECPREVRDLEDTYYLEDLRGIIYEVVDNTRQIVLDYGDDPVKQSRMATELIHSTTNEIAKMSIESIARCNWE